MAEMLPRVALRVGWWSTDVAEILNPKLVPMKLIHKGNPP